MAHRTLSLLDGVDERFHPDRNVLRQCPHTIIDQLNGEIGVTALGCTLSSPVAHSAHRLQFELFVKKQVRSTLTENTHGLC